MEDNNTGLETTLETTLRTTLGNPSLTTSNTTSNTTSYNNTTTPTTSITPKASSHHPRGTTFSTSLLSLRSSEDTSDSSSNLQQLQQQHYAQHATSGHVPTSLHNIINTQKRQQKIIHPPQNVDLTHPNSDDDDDGDNDYDYDPDYNPDFIPDDAADANLTGHITSTHFILTRSVSSPSPPTAPPTAAVSTVLSVPLQSITSVRSHPIQGLLITHSGLTPSSGPQTLTVKTGDRQSQNLLMFEFQSALSKLLQRLLRSRPAAPASVSHRNTSFDDTHAP
eukprot:CAMPEP_0182461746 /NCGR_PEP_ID=MMETSP1319-20130603/6231_1 /TAXON_ID=172717 /ORGANISM="Bolidomonas pacifica, Strain RCC208" /LENGTH=278 /DNA_ID=CAMNT_0024661073 /DNA_START=415 /DNA_END=1247 /DNA_ORIENTATION=+